MRLCFATNNRHKVDEVSKAVGRSFEIISLEELSVFDELPETQDTLEGNALQKALFVFEKTGVACFADDSGLEVNALGGAPGVYSARYAGPQRSSDDNMSLLEKKLEGIEDRKASFRTIIALAGLGEPVFFEGSVKGQILKTRRGTGGFGYDPLFLPDGFDKSFAEMSLEEKNKLSHRSIAVAKLVQYLYTLRSSLS